MLVINQNLPKSCFNRVNFSTIKKRSGRESVPFLGLQAGAYIVKFVGARTTKTVEIKIWLSMHGWAWEVIKEKSE